MEPTEGIVEAILEDHQDLKKFIPIMKDEDATHQEKKKAFLLFSNLLKSHASSEEKVLYTACTKTDDLEVHVQEGFVEHQLATLLMKSIPTTKDKDRWSAQVKVLAEMVEHHIEEEEGEFLPKVQSTFSKEDKNTMALEFIALRKRSQKDVSEDNAGILAENMRPKAA